MNRRVERFSLGMPWEESHGYSQAFRTGNVVHIAGQLPHDATGNLVGHGDASAQAHATFVNLDRVLSVVGASKRQIIENTLMVVGLSDHFEAISKVHKVYFDGHNPVSSAFGVVELALPGQLLEITAILNLDLPK